MFRTNLLLGYIEFVLIYNFSNVLLCVRCVDRYVIDCIVGCLR